jgi:hypothetical protein
MVAGTFRAHDVGRAVILEHGKVTEQLYSACGDVIGDPVVAADLDGDGELDLVYVSRDGIGFVGRKQTGSIDPREGACSDVF